MREFEARHIVETLAAPHFENHRLALQLRLETLPFSARRALGREFDSVEMLGRGIVYRARLGGDSPEGLIALGDKIRCILNLLWRWLRAWQGSRLDRRRRISFRGRSVGRLAGGAQKGERGNEGFYLHGRKYITLRCR